MCGDFLGQSHAGKGFGGPSAPTGKGPQTILHLPSHSQWNHRLLTMGLSGGAQSEVHIPCMYPLCTVPGCQAIGPALSERLGHQRKAPAELGLTR